MYEQALIHYLAEQITLEQMREIIAMKPEHIEENEMDIFIKGLIRE